jgi:hypothetical protein
VIFTAVHAQIPCVESQLLHGDEDIHFHRESIPLSGKGHLFSAIGYRLYPIGCQRMLKFLGTGVLVVVPPKLTFNKST